MYPRVEKQSGLMGPIVWQGKEYPSGVLPPENVVRKFYGNYMRSTSFTNCSSWTIMLVIIWTYWTLPSCLTGKLRFHSVSTQARFNMSLFPTKILDWLMMTSTSTFGLSLHWPLSWSHGKETNLLCWLAISPICLKMMPWNWRKLLQHITVNNFSIILNVQLRFLTAFLWWMLANFNYSGSFIFF